MNARISYAARNCATRSGFRAECRWYDYAVAVGALVLSCAVLVGACDGMLADTVAPRHQLEQPR
jgi:hypothetical protein